MKRRSRIWTALALALGLVLNMAALSYAAETEPSPEETGEAADKVLALMEQVAVKGVSHITGGGFYENIPRSIPDGLGAKIEKAKIRILPIFDLIAKRGGISERDMFNTYTMGVGMSIVVAAADAEKALAILKDNDEDAYVIGEIIESEDKITII